MISTDPTIAILWVGSNICKQTGHRQKTGSGQARETVLVWGRLELACPLDGFGGMSVGFVCHSVSGSILGFVPMRCSCVVWCFWPTKTICLVSFLRAILGVVCVVNLVSLCAQATSAKHHIAETLMMMR